MTQRTYNSISGIVFSVVAIAHLLRIVLGWEFMVGGWDVQTWVSGVAVVMAGFLGYTGWRLRS